MKGGKPDLEITLKQRLDSVLKEIKAQQSLEQTLKSGSSQAETKSKWQFIEMLRKDKKKNGSTEDKKIDSNTHSVPKKSKFCANESCIASKTNQNEGTDI